MDPLLAFEVVDSFGFVALWGYVIGAWWSLAASNRMVKTHEPVGAGMHAAIGLFCLIYVVAWGQVAFVEGLDRTAWSERITPASAVFPVIFAAPALRRVLLGRGHTWIN